MPGRIPEDASRLFARNILNFLTPMIDAETKSLKIDTEDEVVAGTLITRDGRIVHSMLAGGEPAAAKPEPPAAGSDATESDADATAKSEAEGA